MSLEALRQEIGAGNDLFCAASIFVWDSRTIMPSGAVGARGRQIAGLMNAAASASWRRRPSALDGGQAGARRFRRPARSRGGAGRHRLPLVRAGRSHPPGSPLRRANRSLRAAADENEPERVLRRALRPRLRSLREAAFSWEPRVILEHLDEKGGVSRRVTKPARTSPGERYAMNDTTSIVRFRQSDEIDDSLTDILRAGARQLLAQAIEMEADRHISWGDWHRYCATTAQRAQLLQLAPDECAGGLHPVQAGADHRRRRCHQ
jgi:hypothetical protein